MVQNQESQNRKESFGETKQAGKSNDEFIDEIMEKAGGMGKFHFVFYLAVGNGINSIIAWMYYQIPFLI